MPKQSRKKLPCDSNLSIDEIVELAWRDEVTFDDIYNQTGLLESEVIRMMRRHLKASSFRMWRRRVSGRKTRHQAQIQPIRQPQKHKRTSDLMNNT